MKQQVMILLFILFIVCIYNVSGLTNSSLPHNGQGSGFVIQTQPIQPSLVQEQDALNDASSGYFVVCQEVLKTLNVSDHQFDDSSAYINIDVQPANRKLRFDYLNHEVACLPYELSVNGSLKGNLSLFEKYVSELNSTSQIVVGRSSMDAYVYNKTGSGYNGRGLSYQGLALRYPFESVIISFEHDGERFIVVYGVSVEGEINGLRHLKDELNLFENTNTVKHYYDITGLSIYDYMHLPPNQKYYLTKSDEFLEVMNKSLYGMYNETVIDVLTPSGVYLRSIRMNTLNSDKITSFRSNTSDTIVFAGGLFSNIYAWKDLATSLTEEGQDCFLIEITGGPGQDCDSCVNYNYSDLVDEYWPALVATAISVSNDSNITYVGHSNGARTGLNSLEKYDNTGKTNAASYRLPNSSEFTNTNLPPKPIHKYIAVASPGTFNKETIQSNYIKDNGPLTIFNLNNLNYSHTTLNMIKESVFKTNIKNEPEGKISLNLWKNYHFFINSSDDTTPGTNLTVDKFYFIAGDAFWTNDMIVPVDDTYEIFKTVNSSYKIHYLGNYIHTEMCDNKEVHSKIKEYINQ